MKYTKIYRIILLYDQSCMYIAYNNHYLIIITILYLYFKLSTLKKL